MERRCNFGTCQPISDILGIRLSAGLRKMGSLAVLMEACSAHVFRKILWWRESVILTLACPYLGQCQLHSILWVTGSECVLFRSALRGLLWAEAVHGRRWRNVLSYPEYRRAPLYSHVGLEFWVYGFEKVCHCVLRNCFRYARWPGVFPSHEITDLTMRTSILAFPQWKETCIVVEQP